MPAYVGIVSILFLVRLIVGVRELRNWPGETRPTPRDVLLVRALIHLAIAVWGLSLLVM